MGDVDLEAGTVRVERAWDGQVARPTKTHQARRVDLTPGLVERLRPILERSGGEVKRSATEVGSADSRSETGTDYTPRTDSAIRRRSTGHRSPASETDSTSTHRRPSLADPTTWLLPNGAGHPLELRRVRRHFRAALRAAGLPRFRLYDLRHTYATLRLLDGAPPLYVAAQMGHRDALTTMRHYAKWIPGGDRRWVEDDLRRQPAAGYLLATGRDQSAPGRAPE